MIADQVKQLTHALRLFGFHAGCERRAEEAVAQGLHPLEFLRLLLQDEQLMRKDLVAKRLITRAKFRSQADLEDWDQTFDRGLSKARLKELFALTFFHNRENLLFLGKTGAGKTRLAIGVGRRLCQEGVSTRFLSVNRFFEELSAERSAGRYLAYLNLLTKVQAIILDDWGVRSYTHAEATALLDLLEERYQKGSVLITSQVDPKGWPALFEDPVIAEAIVDRLRHPSQEVTVIGGTYRPRLDSKTRKAA